MFIEGHLLKVENRPAKGDFPESWRVGVLDLDAGESYKLAATEEAARLLAPLKPLTPVTLRLSLWRVVADRATAYKLRVVGVEKPAAS
jgi:hypothetical protein